MAGQEPDAERARQFRRMAAECEDLADDLEQHDITMTPRPRPDMHA